MDNYEFFCIDCDWEGSGRGLFFKVKGSQGNEPAYCPNCGSSRIEKSNLDDEAYFPFSILSLTN